MYTRKELAYIDKHKYRNSCVPAGLLRIILDRLSSFFRPRLLYKYYNHEDTACVCLRL